MSLEIEVETTEADAAATISVCALVLSCVSIPFRVVPIEHRPGKLNVATYNGFRHCELYSTTAVSDDGSIVVKSTSKSFFRIQRVSGRNKGVDDDT